MKIRRETQFHISQTKSTKLMEWTLPCTFQRIIDKKLHQGYTFWSSWYYDTEELWETIFILCYMSLLIPVKRMHIDTHFTKDHLKMFMLIFVNMILSVKELYIYRYILNFPPCRHPTKKFYYLNSVQSHLDKYLT